MSRKWRHTLQKCCRFSGYLSSYIDGLHSCLSGVHTGCGMQKIGAAVNLGAFFLLGIPMAVLLAFVFQLNGMGLWLGIVCGSIAKLLFLVFISLFIDWEKEAVKANNKVFSSSLPVYLYIRAVLRGPGADPARPFWHGPEMARHEIRWAGPGTANRWAV